MNERIKELIEQAEDYSAEQHAPYSHHERVLRYEVFKEKFAELIVRECAELARKKNYQLMNEGMPFGVTSTELLNHFGVKE
jgi:hypothetical protein